MVFAARQPKKKSTAAVHLKSVTVKVHKFAAYGCIVREFWQSLYGVTPYLTVRNRLIFLAAPVSVCIDVQKIIWGWLVVTALAVQRGTAKAVTTNPKSFS